MDDTPAWTTLSTYLPGSGDVFDVECHPFNPEVVYITRSSGVYVSEKQEFSWTDISGSLPDINMNTIAFYENSIDGIYVGSDAGVYYRDASMDDWTMFSNGLPVDASVNEIEIYHNPDNPSVDVIRAGTYGRGLWSSPVWHGQPVADFSSEETTVPVGCEVDFYDLSEGVPTSWSWTFEGATPATSSDKNPAGIVYLSQGTFDVTLTVSNDEGTNTKTLSGYMTVSETAVPAVYFVASDSITCSGTEIYFTDMSSNCPTGWSWEFDPSDVTFINGTNAASQNPVVEFTGTGSFTVTLTVTNAAGTSSLEKTNSLNIGVFRSHFLMTLNRATWNPNRGSSKTPTSISPGMWLPWPEIAPEQPPYMDFYDYIVPLARATGSLLPLLNMSDFSIVMLSFKHAYAKRHTAVTDSLGANIKQLRANLDKDICRW
ncbi:MAG: PKD domain-containing protein [Bacteroidales bacterium]